MGALIAMLLVALLRTDESRLRLYFLAELVATMALEAASLTWPDINSRGYTTAYCLIRPIDLGAAIWLARPRAGTLIAALLLGLVALIGLPSHLDTNSAITLLEGAGYALAAMSMVLQPTNRQNTVLLLLWFLLALFDWFYAAGWQLPFWRELNETWPTIVCIVAFGILAIVGSDGQMASAGNRAPER